MSALKGGILQSIAIIIPSKDRLHYCLAQIKYYKKFNFEGKLVIIDSSSESDFSVLEKESKKIDFTNLILLNNPSFSTHQAIEFGLKQVENSCKYFVFSGDDDFFVVDGIYKATHFLDLHPDFIGVVGKGIVAKHIDLKDGIGIGWVRTYWKPRNISDENRLVRASAISRRYINLEFAVKRVSVCVGNQILMNKVFGKVEFNKSTDLEICSTLAIALTGKIKYLKTRFLIRGDHDARPNLVSKPLDFDPAGERRNNLILYLSAVLNKFDKSLGIQAENIITYYFATVKEKKQRRARVPTKFYFFFVRALKKFHGIVLRHYYKKYFNAFFRS